MHLNFCLRQHTFCHQHHRSLRNKKKTNIFVLIHRVRFSSALIFGGYIRGHIGIRSCYWDKLIFQHENRSLQAAYIQ